MKKNHKHLVLNAAVRNPITDEESCKRWLEKLVEIIDMKILIPPVAKFCDTEKNEGVTGTVVIETSHASIHVWHMEREPYIRMDVYSCKDFSLESVVEFVKETMDVIHGGYMIIDRNDSSPSLLQTGIV
jgi:S-adenosylmethionine/arginine decarboxylase-like enzyme